MSVNVTLLFSVERYAQAIGAYWDGLTRRAAAGESLARHLLGGFVLRLPGRRRG